MRCCMTWILILAIGASWGVDGSCAESDPPSSDWFDENIRPILVQHCLKCHGSSKQESNLRLDSLEAMLRGGDSGPAIVSALNHSGMLLKKVSIGV